VRIGEFEFIFLRQTFWLEFYRNQFL
jgi:hypothetical protein